jgi:hypothetical protein
MPPLATYAQALESDHEYVSNFGAEGGPAELARALDITVDRMLPDVPGTDDDAVRALLKQRLTADVLNPQWAAPEVGPELRWTVAARGRATSPTRSTLELLRQYSVGMSECAFALDDVPVVKTLAAGVTVEATCTALDYVVAAPARKGRPGHARAAAGRSRGFNVQWSARIRIAIGPFSVVTRAVLRDLRYTVRAP